MNSYPGSYWKPTRKVEWVPNEWIEIWKTACCVEQHSKAIAPETLIFPRKSSALGMPTWGKETTKQLLRLSYWNLSPPIAPGGASFTCYEGKKLILLVDQHSGEPPSGTDSSGQVSRRLIFPLLSCLYSYLKESNECYRNPSMDFLSCS